MLFFLPLGALWRSYVIGRRWVEGFSWNFATDLEPGTSVSPSPVPFSLCVVAVVVLVVVVCCRFPVLQANPSTCFHSTEGSPSVVVCA